MKRFILAFSAYIVCFFGIFAALLALMALLAGNRDELNLRYFFGGAAIVGFVVSWLLLKTSRQK